jgi:uncharacterized protein YggL (DUF469 family)
MRKRLRKKKHVGEFQELGVEIAITLQLESDFDAFLDDFLCHAVEAHGLAFGGGGSATRLEGILELGRREAHTANLAKSVAWLSEDSRVMSFKTGPPQDLWYLD